MSYQKPVFKEQYENFIGGKWVAPVDGNYFENTSPIDGGFIAKVPRSNSKDIDLAVASAWKAVDAWGKTSVTDRSNLLFKIADRLEANLESLALAETWDNGKSIRETLAADIPLTIDHFRYFGSVIRAESGEVSDLDANTVSMEIHEPLGVVGQIIPWNFPILMAVWKLAPAIAADGYYIKPTVFKGHNKMRIFQEEIFGPVLSVTTFKDEAEALEIANDTLYGLGAGVWTRDVHQMQTFSRGIEAGRIWCNCYHAYPAHASFGGYKKLGIGRETHKMMLNNYRHTKNVLMSYDKNPLGFF